MHFSCNVIGLNIGAKVLQHIKFPKITGKRKYARKNTVIIIFSWCRCKNFWKFRCFTCLSKLCSVKYFNHHFYIIRPNQGGIKVDYWLLWFTNIMVTFPLGKWWSANPEAFSHVATNVSSCWNWRHLLSSTNTSLFINTIVLL